MSRFGTSSAHTPERLRKKQTVSCDGCRLRKAKCLPADDPTIIRGVASIPCEGCRRATIQCTYLNGSKKRGRAGNILGRLRSEQEQRVAREREQNSRSPLPFHPSHASSHQHESVEVRDLSTLIPPTPDRDAQCQPTTGTEDEVLALGDLSWMLDPVTPLPSSNPVFGGETSAPCLPQSPLQSGSKRNEPIHIAHTWTPPLSASMPRRLEDFLPRATASSILELYFDIIYCIIPLVHQPSFISDFRASRDHEHRKFMALVLAMIATTLVHVPRLHFFGGDIEGLSRSCLRESERLVMEEMGSPDIDVVSSRYLHLVIHENLGDRVPTLRAFGDAQSLAIGLGYHWESNYRDLDPVEAERRRRVWYLLYNADKCTSVIGERPVLLRSDELTAPGSTMLPRELRDECITTLGYLFPEGGVPLISGFNIVTRIITILGDVLVLSRARWKLATDIDAAYRSLREVRLLDERLKAVVDSIPEPFVLRREEPRSLQSLEWQESVREDLQQYLQNPSNPARPVNGCTVLKANIHVTLALTQLQLILYREGVQEIISKAGTPPQSVVLPMDPPNEEQNWRSSAYSNLYRAIHEIPVQALAANGPSILNKIRVVAVTLLDHVPADGPRVSEINDTAAYLVDFLNIMTSIEGQFVSGSDKV